MLLGTSIVFLLTALIWTYVLVGHVDFMPGGILKDKIEVGLLPLLLGLYAFGIGKAALMPLHRWLPAAMVAPTPVSAETGVGATIAAGNHRCKGIKAALPIPKAYSPSNRGNSPTSILSLRIPPGIKSTCPTKTYVQIKAVSKNTIEVPKSIPRYTLAPETDFASRCKVCFWSKGISWYALGYFYCIFANCFNLDVCLGRACRFYAWGNS